MHTCMVLLYDICICVCVCLIGHRDPASLSQQMVHMLLLLFNRPPGSRLTGLKTTQTVFCSDLLVGKARSGTKDPIAKLENRQK